MWFHFLSRISQVLVGSAPLKPYGFDKGCKHTYNPHQQKAHSGITSHTSNGQKTGTTRSMQRGPRCKLIVRACNLTLLVVTPQ